MKSQILTTAALLITMTLTALPLQARPKADIAILNTQMKQAVCTQNWGEAAKIVDQIIAITPSSNQKQHSELAKYRVRMQNLYASRTNVDSWLERYCVTPVATPAVSTPSVSSDLTNAGTPVNCDNITAQAINGSSIVLENWHWKRDNFGNIEIEGCATNNTGAPIRDILYAVADFYTEDGQFLNSTECMVQPRPLMPGQTGRFWGIEMLPHPLARLVKIRFKQI